VKVKRDIKSHNKRLIPVIIANKESVLISFDHLAQLEPTLAFFTVQAPAQMLPILDETTYEVLLTIFEQYAEIHSEVKVRFVEFPTTESVRNLR
jgi:DNA replication licensing factor MCM2